jgi:hypothetical protein
MPRGTVKDPTGHQSKDYDFGYIQRMPEDFDEYGKLVWPDGSAQPKSIPFLNSEANLKVGTSVTFDSVEAEVYHQGECVGTIGIAINVVPV